MEPAVSFRPDEVDWALPGKNREFLWGFVGVMNPSLNPQEEKKGDEEDE